MPAVVRTAMFFVVASLRSHEALAGLATGVGPAHPVAAGFLRASGDRETALDADRGFQQVLAEAVARVHDSPQRLAKIEARMAGPAQTLPMDQRGRFGPRAVRFLLQHYFSQEHGWTVAGLEPHGYRSDVSKVHDVHVLREKAPALAALLSQSHDEPLSYDGVVQLAAVLEFAITDEHKQVLHVAYDLNGLQTDMLLTQAQLDEVMFSYLLLFELGFRRLHDVDAQVHTEYKNEAMSPQSRDVFQPLLDLQRASTHTAVWRRRESLNPFEEARFAFEDVSEFAAASMSAYPSLLQAECGGMQAHLQALAIPGTGVVPLGRFYAERGTSNLEYSFTESTAYLQATGAIDQQNNVRIANYMQGPTNCMQTSSYYSICCMSECDVLHAQIMGAVQAPEASVEFLLGLLANATWEHADEPMPADAVSKLRMVASKHDGMVPLHSRLFAQWLHYVFPSECPYPSAPQSEALSVHSWKDGSAIASSTVINAVIEEQGLEASQYWDDDFEELLPLLEPGNSPSALGDAARCIFLVFLAGSIFRYTMSGYTVARRAYYRQPAAEDSKHLV